MRTNSGSTAPTSCTPVGLRVRIDRPKRSYVPAVGFGKTNEVADTRPTVAGAFSEALILRAINS